VEEKKGRLIQERERQGGRDKEVEEKKEDRFKRGNGKVDVIKTTICSMTIHQSSDDTPKLHPNSMS